MCADVLKINSAGCRFLLSLRTLMLVSSKPTWSKIRWLFKLGHLLCFHSKHNNCYFHSGEFAHLLPCCWTYFRVEAVNSAPRPWITSWTWWLTDGSWMEQMDSGDRWLKSSLKRKSFFLSGKRQSAFQWKLFGVFCPALNSDQLEPIKNQWNK